MVQFIKIQNVRIRLSTIKKYGKVNDNTLSIYYNASSRYKVDNELFKFDSAKELRAILLSLDLHFIHVAIKNPNK